MLLALLQSTRELSFLLYLKQDIGNRVVAMQGGKIVDLDINEALDMPRVFDEELYKIAMTISI